MKQIPLDYKPPQGGGGMSDVKDGKYKMVGLKWFSKDSNDNPILVLQKNGMVARARIKLEGEEGTAVHFPHIWEVPMLLSAFQVKDMPPPPTETEQGAISQYLKAVEEKINASKLTPEVEVKGNFVQRIQGAEVPSDFYVIRPIKVTSVMEGTKDTPGWYTQKWPSGGESKRFNLLIQVLGSPLGETQFSGSVFSVQVDYPIKVNEETNEAEFEKNDEGKWTSGSTAVSRLFTFTAPEVFDNQPSNPHNIIPHWLKYANLPLSTPMMTSVEVKESKSGYRYYQVDWFKAKPLPDFKAPEWVDNIAKSIYEGHSGSNGSSSEQEEVKPQVPTQAIDKLDVKGRELLVEGLAELGGITRQEFANGFTLNDKGREIAIKYLTPLTKTGKIQSKAIAEMSFAECQATVTALLESVSEEERLKVLSTKQKLEFAMLGLDETVEVIKPDNDCPF